MIYSSTNNYGEILEISLNSIEKAKSFCDLANTFHAEIDIMQERLQLRLESSRRMIRKFSGLKKKWRSINGKSNDFRRNDKRSNHKDG